jgi:hypothetical protein
VSTAFVGTPFEGGQKMGQVSKDKLRNLRQHTQKRPVEARIQQRTASTKNESIAHSGNRRPIVALKPTVQKRQLASNVGRQKTNKTAARRQTGEPNARKVSVYPTWHWQWTHPYLMTTFAFTIAISTVLLHGTDLLIEWPFHGVSKVYDAIAGVCALGIAIMCWPVYQDLPKG